MLLVKPVTVLLLVEDGQSFVTAVFSSQTYRALTLKVAFRPGITAGWPIAQGGLPALESKCGTGVTHVSCQELLRGLEPNR
jgi:hypothetical protein